MKSLRKRRSFKPFIIKRNLSKPNRFYRKRNLQKRSLMDFKLKPRPLFSASTAKHNNPLSKQLVSDIDFHSCNDKNESIAQPGSSLQKKNWWTPVWSGLLMEESGKHQKTIRQAIWLYLFLLTAANRRTGILYRKLSTITDETGFHRRSVERWLRTLRDNGYVETHSTGRALQISITKWKPILPKKSEKKLNQ